MPTTRTTLPQSTVRLFVGQPLSAGTDVKLEGPQAHYLLGVMRLKMGDPVKLCDDISGEWLGIVSAVAKRDLVLHVTEQLRPREPVRDLWLAAAPIRRSRYGWVAEKSCELGVARFVPVLTRRTVIDKVKDDRLRAHMVEAAEQCGRTALPELADQMSLDGFLKALDSRTLFFADEEGGQPFVEAIAAHPGPAAILIGPEGGFDDAERATIGATPGAVRVSLGPLILRADTAAVAAVSVWMACARCGGIPQAKP